MSPLMMEEPTRTAEEEAVLDRELQSAMGSRVIVQWDPAWGVSVIVSAIRVVWQLDENGERKGRLILDLRYANGGCRTESLILPSVQP